MNFHLTLNFSLVPKSRMAFFQQSFQSIETDGLLFKASVHFSDECQNKRSQHFGLMPTIANEKMMFKS
jgi:hypothetical protein